MPRQIIKNTQSRIFQEKSEKRVKFMTRQEQSDSSVIEQNQVSNSSQKSSNAVKQMHRKLQPQSPLKSPIRAKEPSKNSKVQTSKLIPCLFSYIRKIKVNPTLLLDHLERRQKKYDPKNELLYYPFYPKDTNFAVKTSSGKQGVSQLIEFIKDEQSRQTNNIVNEVNVQWSHELHLAAIKRVNAIEKGAAGIQAMDVGQLVNEFTNWKNPLCEIVVYGFLDPKQILIQAFLQDQSNQKNNRAQFFNQCVRYVGIDMGYHNKYQIVTVIILAGGVSKLTHQKMMENPKRQCECGIF